MELNNNEEKDVKVQTNCTYEGCALDWDENEKVYICPCCGSRFGFDGKVIQGPATEDLPAIAGL